MRIYTGLHRLVHIQILYFAEEPEIPGIITVQTAVFRCPGSAAAPTAERDPKCGTDARRPVGLRQAS